MDTLAKLLGGQARIRIMRLFLLNPEQSFEIEDVISRSRIQRGGVRKELNALSSVDFIKQKTTTKEGSRGGKKKVNVWMLNPYFQYLNPMKDLLIDPEVIMQDDLPDRIKPTGKIHLIIVAGVFIGRDDSRVDMMIVGDRMKKNVLNQVIKGLESEIGKELDYVVFDTKEFVYRINMYDKLVCDILDYPHIKVFENPKLSTRPTRK